MLNQKGLNIVVSGLMLSLISLSPSIAQDSTNTKSSEEMNRNNDSLLLPSQAQEVEIINRPAITLEEAVSLGLANNKNLSRAKLELDRAQEGLNVAQAQEKIFVDGTANTTFSGNQAQGFLGNTHNLATGAGVELGYRLYTGGRLEATINRASEEIKFAELEVNRLTQQTRFEVATAYYQLQNSDAQVNIAQAAVDDFTQTLRDAELLERAGLGTRFDVLQARVDLANANQALTRARADQRNAKRELATVIGIPATVEYSAADEIEEQGNWSLSLEQSIVQAYQNREELDQILARREINNQDRIIATSRQKPQVNLFANYNFNLNVADSRPLGVTGYSDGYNAGARLTWNLRDGGEAKALEKQEEISIAIDENDFAGQRNTIRLEVETAYNDLTANKENIGTTEQAAITATESLRLARLRFQAGVGTQTDVINAQRALTEARGNFLQAIIGYNQSLNRLQRAVSQQ